ncbi:hypothetical protein NLX65_00365 [Candidatus Cardinium sp. TP]|nr:hypothetical protein [Candidatus Cardinium sp. TP]
MLPYDLKINCMKTNVSSKVRGSTKSLLTSLCFYFLFIWALAACNRIKSNMNVEHKSSQGELISATGCVSKKWLETAKVDELKQFYDKILILMGQGIENSSLVTLSDSIKVRLDRTSEIDADALSAHGTDGMSCLLALLTGKQLLPSNERDKRGIPTITGEAKCSTSKVYYHNDSQYFVSILNLQHSAPNFQLVDYLYLDNAYKSFPDSYDVFKEKLFAIGKGIPGIGIEALNKLFCGESMCQLYTTLSNLPIIVIGDGVGLVDHSMYREYNYKRVNLRAIVVPNEYKESFKDLFCMLGIEDIALISRREFYTFYNERERSKRKLLTTALDFEEGYSSYIIKDIPIDCVPLEYVKVYGYNDKETFIEKFGTSTLRDFYEDLNNYVKNSLFAKDFLKRFKLPCSFSAKPCSDVTNDEEFVFDNKGSTEQQIISITYRLPSGQ